MMDFMANRNRKFLKILQDINYVSKFAVNFIVKVRLDHDEKLLDRDAEKCILALSIAVELILPPCVEL